jgi:predicted DCC family thiol-disulfide oxidoreductase YuxK
MTEPAEGALLLFDGTCGFCARSVQFVLRHEGRRRTLRFASLGSPTGRAIRARHPELDGVDSVVWYDRSASTGNERVLVRSLAVLRVLAYLGGIWRVAGWLGAVVPRVVRDRAYDFVARHRHKLTRDRAGAACLVPTPDQRVRFIDWDG